MLEQAVKLIVGLGNPGPQYTNTRHNVGQWFVKTLAERTGTALKTETKLKGLFGKGQISGEECRLLLPITYMNCSGESVQACAKFYKIAPESILVIHDELDFAPGTIRLKVGGGHAGHNGLRNIVSHIHSNNFLRLRIGIGRPANKDIVTDYVLHSPAKAEKQKILVAIENGIDIIPELIVGNIDQATKSLHTEEQ